MNINIFKCFVIAISFFSIIGCTNNTPKTSEKTHLSKREYSVQSVLWQQNSSEYKALCYQAFNLAKYRLDAILAKKEDNKPLAIITDIDETILDNSPFNAKMIELDVDYSKEEWFDWGRNKSAKSIPGALEFINYANSNNVAVFYISNRHVSQKKETIENLKQVGFLNVEEQYVLLKNSTSKKGKRRDKVITTHNVVMLLGDNLSDFAQEFEELNREESVEQFMDEFGSTFIVLPNPMYGDWENKGIYHGKYDWTDVEKDSIRKSKLISF